MSQFFYLSTKTTEEKLVLDSFNIHEVLRTTETKEGFLLVQLNDGRMEETIYWKLDENKEIKRNKEGVALKDYTDKKWKVSEAVLVRKEDIDNFRKVTSVIPFAEESDEETLKTGL